MTCGRMTAWTTTAKVGVDRAVRRVRSKAWIGALLLVIAVSAVCIRLGFWQLERLAQRRAYNAAVVEAMERPPLELDGDAIAALQADPGDHLYRRATAKGELIPGSEIVLRGRSHRGQPGIHLVAAMRLADGGVILVNRGWVPSPDATTLDPRPLRVPGRRIVEGLLQAMPPPDAELAPVSVEAADTAIVTYRRLGAAALDTPLAAGLPPLYLQVLPSSPAPAEPPIPVPAPTLSEGSHLSYAVQWFSFAAIAILGFLITVRLRLKASAGTAAKGV